MTAYDEFAQRYIDTWNETDPSARRAVDQLYTEDARYVDPMGVADGREAIAARAGAVPGFSSLAGPVDGHHNQARSAGSWGPRVAGADRRLRRRVVDDRPHPDHAGLPRQGARELEHAGQVAVAVDHGVLQHQADVCRDRHQQHELSPDVQRQPVVTEGKQRQPGAGTTNSKVSSAFSSSASSRRSPGVRWFAHGGSEVAVRHRTRISARRMIESPSSKWTSGRDSPSRAKASAK